MIFDCWSINRGVRLHYLDNHSREEVGVPLVFIPGLRGSAEDFRPMLDAFVPRRTLAVSLRGRGQSDVPQTGYTFQDHVEDIAAVIQQAGLTKFVLFGHSIGVTYAIGFALQFPENVSGLILGGYPAQYPSISADWVMQVVMQRWNEMPLHTALGIQHDSEALSLWERLRDIHCPMMVMYGEKETSKLKADVAEKYREYAPQTDIVTYEDSGHRLWVPNFDRFVTTVNRFMRHVDVLA